MALRVICLILFQNYLTNRRQCVVLNGIESNWGDIRAGVPQRSVLGPLLFLIYINDIEKGILSHVKFFADDPLVSAHELQHDLNLISEWACQ